MRSISRSAHRVETLVKSQGEHAKSSPGSTERGTNYNRFAHSLSSSQAGRQRCLQFTYRRRAHASRPQRPQRKGIRGRTGDPCRRGKTGVFSEPLCSESGEAAAQISVFPENHQFIRKKLLTSSASAFAASHLEIVADSCVLNDCLLA